MGVPDPAFFYVFLPIVFALYFPLVAIEAAWPRAPHASLLVLLGAGLAFVLWYRTALAPALIVCHAVAYVIERRRGDSPGRGPLQAALYPLQFPLLVAGPIVRLRDFSAQVSKRAIGVGHFSYGVRRVVIGALKVTVVAAGLAVTTDVVFAAPPAALSAAAAWLGAVSASLLVYFLFGGYADIAIGLGRMLGFRYPENFRRPYTADSMREFWRRWNITLLTWLRDYVELPIAGQGRPTLRRYFIIVASFCLVAWWHGAGARAVWCGVYFGSLLALEAAGLGQRIDTLWKPVRHAYVLLAVMVGWVIAQTGTALPAFVKAMIGLNTAPRIFAASLLSWPALAVLGLALLGAGPLVPWISRWRVGVDAATTSLLMMIAATALFLWRPIGLALRGVTRNAGGTRGAGL